MVSKDSASSVPTVLTLNDGTTLPTIGLGSMEQGIYFAEEEKPRILKSILHAIKTGYRLIDTSMWYSTEALVGQAIRDSEIPRSEFTVVTKLPQAFHHDPEAGLQLSLGKLDIGYIDIFIMHWPCAMSPDGKRPLPLEESPTYIETYKMMEKLVGPQCRHIGVSNLTQKTLGPLLQECTIKPVINETEVNPLNPNLKLVPWCQERGIQVMAWGPLAGGSKSAYVDSSATYDNDTLKSIASHHQVSVGVIMLSWLVHRKISVIPHSSSHARLTENFNLVPLTDKEVQQVNELHLRLGTVRLIDHVAFVWLDNVIPGKGKTMFGWTAQEMGWVDQEGNSLT